MILWHATPSYNHESILSLGLCVRYSLSTARRVWLHGRAKRKWAKQHVGKKHGDKPESLVLFKVEVPDSWLHRFSDGVWWCDRDIPPAHFTEVEFPKGTFKGLD